MVGLEVSPVLVLILNSPRTQTPVPDERTPGKFVKLAVGVRTVLLPASLAPDIMYNRDKLDKPEIVLDPKPFEASVV
jgi:hypothetical protein